MVEDEQSKAAAQVDEQATASTTRGQQLLCVYHAPATCFCHSTWNKNARANMFIVYALNSCHQRLSRLQRILRSLFFSLVCVLLLHVCLYLRVLNTRILSAGSICLRARVSRSRSQPSSGFDHQSEFSQCKCSALSLFHDWLDWRKRKDIVS